MLDFLLQQLLEDSGLGSLAPQLQQVLPLVKGYFANQLTGTSKSTLRASDFMGNRTVARMLESKARAAGISDMYGRILSRAEDTAKENASVAVFRAFGYDEASAKIAAGTGLGRTIAGFSGFIDPTIGDVDTGASSIASALYSRRNMMRIRETGALESHTSQARSGQRLIDDLLKEHDRGSFGRLSFAEVGALTSSMIKTGELDAAYTDPGGGSGADTRTARVKAKIKSYGESIEKLKDVIEGDMSKILDSMDKLFGGTTVSMSAAKLNKITTAMQHAALVTGVDAKTIAQNAGVGYSYVADLGGTQGMGVRLGLDTTYITQSLPSDSRLSQSEMRSAALMSSANIYRSGQAKNLAVGYHAWRQLKENETKSLDEYVKTLGGDVSNSTLIKSIRRSISDQYNGASDEQIAAVHAHYNRLPAVTDIMETEAITAVIREQKAEQFITYRERSLKTKLTELKDKGQLAKGLSVEAAYRELTGGARFARTDDMLNKVTSVVKGAGVDALSNELVYYRGVAQEVMGTATDRQGEELIRSAGRSEQLRKQKLVADTLDADAMVLLNDAMRSKDKGIFHFLMRASGSKSNLLGIAARAYKTDLATVSNTTDDNSIASKAIKVLGRIKSGERIDEKDVDAGVKKYIQLTTGKPLEEINKDNAAVAMVAVSEMSSQLYSISQSKKGFDAAIKDAQAQGIPIMKFLANMIGAPNVPGEGYASKKVQQAMALYKTVGPGSKSAFVGMRKILGDGAEEADTGKELQKAYLLKIKAADAAIIKAQKTGKLVAADKATIRTAIEASDMEEHEKSVYRLLADGNPSGETVKYLSATLRDPEKRGQLFSSMKRLDNIATALYAKDPKNLAKFRTAIVPLQAKFDKARADGLGDEIDLLRKFKTREAAADYIKQTTDEGQKADLKKANALLVEADNLIGGTKAPDDLKQSFLDSISRGSSGSEDWLSAIFTLLKDIFNKMK